jgi:hypothetical protein
VHLGSELLPVVFSYWSRRVDEKRVLGRSGLACHLSGELAAGHVERDRRMAFESRYPNTPLSWWRKPSSVPDAEMAVGDGGLLGTVVVDGAFGVNI